LFPSPWHMFVDLLVKALLIAVIIYILWVLYKDIKG